MRRPAFVAALLLAAGCSEQGIAPPAGRDAGFPDDANQVMFGITTFLTNRGVRAAQLRSDTAYFYDDNSRVELRSVDLTFYRATGARDAVLTSREGTYNMRAQQMEARGSVVVVSEDGRRLTSEQLRYDQARDEISSDSAFVLTEPSRRIEGVGFVSDPDLRNIRVLKITSGSGPIDLSGGVQTPPPATAAPPRPAPTPDGRP